MNQAFVIMPIGNPEMDKIYNEVYVPVLEKKCGLKVKRIDKHNTGGLLKSEIVSYIRDSIIIIADLTHERPNCYLEVGYAMGLEKYQHLILVVREDHNPDSPNYNGSGPKIHFDLIGYNILFWDPDNLVEFESQLERTIKYRLSILDNVANKEIIQGRTFPNGWLVNKLPNIEGFCWLSLGFIFPIKSESEKLVFDVFSIKQIKNAVETHVINGIKVWTQKFCPFPINIEEPMKKINFRDARIHRGKDIANIQTQSGEYYVRFNPDPLDSKYLAPIGLKEPDPLKGEWFDIWFDARGFMIASIGFPWNRNGISVEEVFSAFLAITDLFNHEKVKECFPYVLWGSNNFKVFAKVNQFPGELLIPSYLDVEEMPDKFPTKGSSWGGPHESEIVKSLEPEEVARHFTYRFIRSYGILMEKEQLQKLTRFKH